MFLFIALTLTAVAGDFKKAVEAKADCETIQRAMEHGGPKTFTGSCMDDTFFNGVPEPGRIEHILNEQVPVLQRCVAEAGVPFYVVNLELGYPRDRPRDGGRTEVRVINSTEGQYEGELDTLGDIIGAYSIKHPTPGRCIFDTLRMISLPELKHPPRRTPELYHYTYTVTWHFDVMGTLSPDEPPLLPIESVLPGMLEFNDN